MFAGLLAAFSGDCFIAIKGSPAGTPGFLAGVACFSLAHCLWISGNGGLRKIDFCALVASAPPLLMFSIARVAAGRPPATACALVAYTALSAVSFAVAAGTRRAFYFTGISLLVFSDVMIGFRMLHAPGAGLLVGPSYIAALAFLVRSGLGRDERRFSLPLSARRTTILCATAAGTCFFVGMRLFPGGGYNPTMRMLSALGRSAVRGVEWPWSHHFFCTGMAFGAFGAGCALAAARSRTTGRRRRVLAFGAAANCAGLLAIALVPENENAIVHNLATWLAALGAVASIFALDRRVTRRRWTVALCSVALLFCGAVALHAAGAIAFAPAVTTLQKALIASFACWTLRVAFATSAPARKYSLLPELFALAAAIAVATGAVILTPCHRTIGPPAATEKTTPRLQNESEPDNPPLAGEELAALAWLERVTGALPLDEEKEWWDIGGSQHGLSAKRYHIAFCGYAAAVLGLHGSERDRARASAVVAACIERYLRRDVWAYSMSKSYWGRKPWAPDPCRRENVMYTGHLLQLLALYETLCGDEKYWQNGWDFVWKDGRKVHYTVQTLVDTTVSQMRESPCGGITCEPGLMFFPCNNHHHIALSLFSKLGHGTWHADARRWEKWALSHYPDPILGGGALHLVHHVRSGCFYPAGHNGLDGWSLMWFEPWAENRDAALRLWRKAAAEIDWADIASDRQDAEPFDACRNPADVPPVVSAVFLAAAARACDDPETALKLEGIADRHLKSASGEYWLDIDRQWRIGASAVRIIALAQSRGFSLRRFVR